MQCGLTQAIKGKKNGHIDTEETGQFWICKAIEIDTRLRIGSIVDKDEIQSNKRMLLKLKGWGHAEEPPAITTDGRGGCQDAMKELWGEENEDKWQYIQFIRQKIPGEGIRTKTKIIFGNASTIDYLGANLSYVDRTQLTSRQMNGRLVRKTLSFSKKGKFLEASCILDDWIYNLVKTVRTLKLKENEKWQYISPAMKAHITDHI